MRRQLATYAAAIAIILNQLDAAPRSTITRDPNPLVRISDHPSDSSGWHPDELIVRATGTPYVLTWDLHLPGSESTGPQISSN